MNEMGLQDRVRLIAALVVMAALSLLSAVGIGIALHGRSETIDSLEHWRGRLASADDQTPPGFDSPAGRIRRLEAELDAVPGRLFARGFMFIFATGLLVLGVRHLRRRSTGRVTHHS